MRIAYNPWTSLYWLVTGRTLGGLALYAADNRLDRETALRLWTEGSAWFSNESGSKGRIAKDQLADLTVLSADYLAVPEQQILDLESVLTVVGGRIVYASDEFRDLAPPALPVSPDWSPNSACALEQRRAQLARGAATRTVAEHGAHCHVRGHRGQPAVAPARGSDAGFRGVLGCSCFAP